MPANLSSTLTFHTDFLETATGLNLTNPLVAGFLSIAIGMLPILIGILIIRVVKGWESHRKVSLSGFAAGILLASFYDLMKETAGLSGSTLKGEIDALNVSLFSIALVVFYLVHRAFSNSGTGIGVAYLWAVLGIGFHGFGEGIIIGYDFTTGFTILSTPQVLSFSLHKLAEGLTIGVLLYYSSRVRWIHPIANTIVAGVPVTFGTLLGLFGLPTGTSTIFFAMAAGATAYAVTNLFNPGGSRIANFALGILAGFLYMYFAGVLHQFE